MFAVQADQAQGLHAAAVLRPGRSDIDAGGIDAGMAQNIRQFPDILIHGIKYPGEQMAQIVGEYLAGGNPCLAAQALHLPPDFNTVDRTAPPGKKNGAGTDIAFPAASQILKILCKISKKNGNIDFFIYLCRP